MTRRMSEANPDLLDGLVSDEPTEEPLENDDEVVATTCVNLASMSLDFYPGNHDDALTGLRESLQALGLLPDPEALGCNLGDNFVDGSSRLKKRIQKSREGSE